VLEVLPKCQVYCIEVFTVGNSKWAGDIDIKGRAEKGAGRESDSCIGLSVSHMSSDTTEMCLCHPGTRGVVARGTVECGALTVNMRIRKTKTSVLENGLTF
jgi:hypothetical protein